MVQHHAETACDKDAARERDKWESLQVLQVNEIHQNRKYRDFKRESIKYQKQHVDSNDTVNYLCQQLFGKDCVFLDLLGYKIKSRGNCKSKKNESTRHANK